MFYSATGNTKYHEIESKIKCWFNFEEIQSDSILSARDKVDFDRNIVI
jgi:hypothetical protein